MLPLSQDHHGSRPIILIVEDDADYRHLMESLLQDEGYDTVVTQSGKGALNLLGLADTASSPQVQPDLVLLNIALRGLSGYCVCEQIRRDEDYGHLPIVVVSAQDSFRHEMKALEHGADDYVLKPFHAAELLARVEAHLKGRVFREARQRARETLKRRATHMKVVSDIGAQIASTLDLTAVAKKVTSLVRESFGYQHVKLCLVDSKRDGLVLAAADGGPGYLLPDDVCLAYMDELVAWVACHGEILLTDGARERLNGTSPDGNDASMHSGLILPVCKGKDVLAVLDVQSRDVNAFDQDDVAALETLASLVAAMITNAKSYERAKQEIRQRQQAEAALRESNRRLEQRGRFVERVLDSVPSSVCVVNRQLRIVSSNRNFLRKMRRTANTVVGRPITEVFPPVLLDAMHLTRKLQQVLRTGERPGPDTVSYRAPGVPERLYYYRIIPLPDVGRSKEVMLVIDDITEQEHLREEARRSERYLASLVECTEDIVLSLDTEGHIVTWNQGAETITGLKAADAKGASLASLCVPEDRQEMTRCHNQATWGQHKSTKEARLLIQGRTIPIAWSCSPLYDRLGQITGFVMIGRDLTEQHELREQLVLSAKMASLGIMAGGIAHEVRNPLAIISAAAQLLGERPDDTHLRAECVDKICNATHRASETIESLLRFARPERREGCAVDIHAVLQQVLDLLAHQLALDNVVVRDESLTGKLQVQGSPPLLRQVFTNLIMNAKEAMRQGGVLTITTRTTNDESVEIAFEDTGYGIQPDHLERIFDPLFTTMPVGEAIGLGLALSYSIVQQHNGSINVESELGKGSTFTVRLPAVSTEYG